MWVRCLLKQGSCVEKCPGISFLGLGGGKWLFILVVACGWMYPLLEEITAQYLRMERLSRGIKGGRYQ
jgi:hypothetical protein